jgi:hypothetical protein
MYKATKLQPPEPLDALDTLLTLTRELDMASIG